MGKEFQLRGIGVRACPGLVRVQGGRMLRGHRHAGHWVSSKRPRPGLLAACPDIISCWELEGNTRQVSGLGAPGLG